MAPGDYKVQAWIGEKYKPLIIRGRPLHEQTDRLDFAEKRRNCDQNIDLWLDGSLYPVDPRSGKRPRIDSPSSLLEFVGDGGKGLLGYIKSLESNSSGSMQKEVENNLLRARIDELVLQSGEDSSRFECIIAALQNDLFLLQIQLSKTCRDYEHQLSSMFVERNNLEAKNSNLKDQHDHRLKEIEAAHSETISGLNSKIVAVSKDLRNTKARLQRLKKTPYGIRSHIRARRDLSELVPSGGHAKAARRLARAIIAPETTRQIHAQNALGSTHRRLCGTQEMQERTGKVFGSLLSRTEVGTLMTLPAFKTVGVRMANFYLNKIGEKVGTRSVLQTCDESGITQAGYNSFYKKFKGGIRSAGKGLRLGCLPNPHQVQLLRKELNMNLEDLVGQPMFISNTYEVAPSTKKNQKSAKEGKLLTLDKFNNLFLDIESVQRTMIRLYKITEEGTKFTMDHYIR